MSGPRLIASVFFVAILAGAASAQVVPAGKVDNDAEKPEVADLGPPVSAAFGGNPARGRKIYAECAACHSLDRNVHAPGPSLFRVVGRDAGVYGRYRYSAAMKNAGVEWSEDALFAFLENPADYIPGNAMDYKGLTDARDRIDLVAYLAAEAD